MAGVDQDTLAGWLTRLRLTAVRDQLDNLLDEAAERKLTLREALALFVEREVARKDERRIGMAFQIAHFPAVRELADFDFPAQRSVDERQIRELAASRWVAHGDALLLPGPPGVGKTHLAEFVDDEHRCRSVYAVSSGGQFWMSPGVSFGCRLTGTT